MSTTSTTPFFTLPENLDALQRCSRALRNFAAASEQTQIAKPLRQIIDLMISNAPRFDEYCTVNIEWIGKDFISAISTFPDLLQDESAVAIASAFTSAFRFLCELAFMQPFEPSLEVKAIENFVDKNIELFTGYERQQITYALYLMPVQIAKKLLNNPAIVEFRKFSQTVEAASKLKAEWETDLNERRVHVDSIREGLKGATSTYNFVGLVDGFRHLAATKITERRVAFWSLIVLAIVMVMPPSGQIFYVLTHIDSIESKKEILLYTLPTILAIEVILIYFFRVVLAQFRSVKAQVLQLDLRIALCQFVESYAEYSVKIKKDDPNVLAKFEAVVFSSLVPDNEGIPSTFDGAEQLSNLIKSIRGT